MRDTYIDDATSKIAVICWANIGILLAVTLAKQVLNVPFILFQLSR